MRPGAALVLALLAAVAACGAARAEDAAETCKIPDSLLSTESRLPKVEDTVKSGHALNVLVVGSRSSTINGAQDSAYPARLQAALKEKLPAVPVGTASYSRVGKSEAESRVTWRVLMPGATSASTGLPDKKGAAGEPWLQLAGTPNAHIHIK